jgi:hypothetical protein
MAQRARERRLADHVAGQAHGGGVEAFRQFDAAAFRFAADGWMVKCSFSTLAQPSCTTRAAAPMSASE